MDVPSTYKQYLALTGDAHAASNLVLADAYALKHPPIDNLLDTQQAIAFLNCSRSLLQSLVDSGELRHVRLGRAIRFKREWLEELVTPKTKPGRHW